MYNKFIYSTIHFTYIVSTFFIVSKILSGNRTPRYLFFFEPLNALFFFNY